MAPKFSVFVFDSLYKLTLETCFFVCLILLTVTGIIVSLVSLIKAKYSLRDFVRHLLINLSILTFQFIHLTLLKGEIQYLLINFFTCLIFFAVAFCLPVRKKKLKKEEKELVSFIDKQIKMQGVQTLKPEKQTFREVEEKKPSFQDEIITKAPNEIQKQEKVKDTLDFSHVKNVIERLNYFPLSVADRRQVKDLEGVLIDAEAGEDSPQLKSKINDGLGALLKIMSKYGA